MQKADKPRLKRNRPERLYFDLLHRFYLEHHREVMAYALFFTRNEDDAVDTLQETFCQALESLKNGAEVENPRSWLVKIARNSMIRRKERQQMERRSWQKHSEMHPLYGNFTPRLLNRVLADSIDAYIEAHFTSDEQEIFVLRHYHEMNLTEIAHVTGKPTTTVHRVLEAITNRIGSRFLSLAG